MKNTTLEMLNECNLCKSNEIIPLDRDHNIFKCRQCQYVFDNPRPTKDKIASFYSKSNQFDLWLGEEKGRDILWQRRLKMIKKIKKRGMLLDVGTGIGQFLFFAKNDFYVMGTEISESAIKIAKSRRYDLDIKKGEIEQINFEGLKFDVITILHVLEQVSNPSSFMERCRDLLSEEGIIIIAVPNDINSLRSRLRYLLSILEIGRCMIYGKYGLPKITMDNFLPEIHLSHFTRSTLRKWLNSLGLSIIEDTLDPYYAAVGIEKLFHDLLYFIFLGLRKCFGINLYDTIWIIAKRK